MIVFWSSSAGNELCLQADTIDDAIEIVFASQNTFAKRPGFRLEASRGNYLRLCVPVQVARDSADTESLANG